MSARRMPTSDCHAATFLSCAETRRAVRSCDGVTVGFSPRMPEFQHGATSIYYEEHGRGFPLLLFAPGGMNSTVERWTAATLNPLAEFRDDFRLIAMDQRNAGRSAGPLEVDDPWGSFARDQLALLDHLGVEQCHVMGCCIGCSFALKLLELAPERFAAAVLEQPVGVVGENRHLYDVVVAQLGRGPGGHAPGHRRRAARAVRHADVGRGEFVVSVGREFVRSLLRRRCWSCPGSTTTTPPRPAGRWRGWPRAARRSSPGRTRPSTPLKPPRPCGSSCTGTRRASCTRPTSVRGLMSTRPRDPPARDRRGGRRARRAGCGFPGPADASSGSASGSCARAPAPRLWSCCGKSAGAVTRSRC